MLNNPCCYWVLVLCLWSPVTPRLQEVKHAGPTVTVSIHRCVVNWCTKTVVWTSAYVIGHRYMMVDYVFPKGDSISTFSVSQNGLPSVKWIGKPAFLPPHWLQCESNAALWHAVCVFVVFSPLGTPATHDTGVVAESWIPTLILKVGIVTSFWSISDLQSRSWHPY